MKRCAVGAQPCPRRCRVFAQQRRDQRMKGRAVVHVHAVRHFMRNRCPAHRFRCQNEPPAISNNALRGTTAPPRARIAKANALDRDTRSQGIILRLIRKCRQRLPLQPRSYPAADTFNRTATAQFVTAALDPAWPCRLPADDKRRITKWHDSARYKGARRRQARPLRVDPGTLLARPAQGWADGRAPGEGEPHRTRDRVNAQPGPARARVAHNFDSRRWKLADQRSRSTR